ncbi:site-2 protease family protein [Desulfolutivibrio sulfoxidireducens]|uniref:site-2 protease family protein n=1 Tax=Desulfolutivibrio sulfoxidireducens TaxID=2773299 RepID=UPI00159D0785|nr:site-2 protease family protein [Desulfolutivibrio sulfoxidireducens]QLA15429.1 site-2 protease family protein [Desulfolutivibrio sulfoxidireducens]QLA19027.1 site-2 protease family protein [Desulfolutivibrio sulfoxidireducens]
MSFDIASYVREIALLAVPLLVAVTFHEVAHGYVAYLLGDPTAKAAGRLTLNPLKHLDPLGVLAFLLTRMIGWAKPVPVDARYFKNPARGMVLVAVAGPAMNFLLAMAFSVLFRLIGGLAVAAPQGSAMAMVWEPLAYMCLAGVTVNLAIGLFNLLPIPPLDGSRIVAGLLPPRAAYGYLRYERYGFFLVILLAVTGILGKLLIPAILVLRGLLL